MRRIIVPPIQREDIMQTILNRLSGALLALALISGPASAQSKVTIAVGGGGCLCYLPTILAKQLGEFDKAGVNVDLVDLKGGSDALKAMLGGSADVVSGYFDHCVNLAAKKQELQAFVVYDRYPGLVLVVAPAHTKEINSVKDLAGKKVGVTAPGSSTDFFLKYLLKKNGQDPGGSLYATTAWVNSHEKEVQALTNAIVSTLAWIHAHSPEEIMAKMPPEMVGKEKDLYLTALKNTIPMYSETGKMDPKGADAVLAMFSVGSPDVAKANIDVSKTYTNKFVEQAKKTTGMKRSDARVQILAPHE
jgi:NitT/TauT family transport system substrate-binding protein